MNNSSKLAYLAGILDGEGHFSIVLHKPKRRHSPLVGVVNTDQRLMAWLRDNFGGAIYHRRSPSEKKHWKDRFEWRLSQKEIDALLPHVIPYLVIKKPRAEAILKLRATSGTTLRSKGLPATVFKKREQIRLALIALNSAHSPQMNLGC